MIEEARAATFPLASGERPLDVMIVDADATSRGALVLAVRTLGYTCQVARNAVEALTMHRRQPSDIVLTDSAMPGMSGLDLCRAVRSQESAGYTYVIAMTHPANKGDLVEAIRAGADANLFKPVDLEELEARLAAGQRVVSRSRVLESTNRRLRRESERALQAASIDALTGVSSRYQLEADLLTMQSRALRYGHRYCAALCDVDGFKLYNDRFGHLAGDGVLRDIARTVRQELRRGDGFYRYGGDEFLAILPEQSLVEGAAVMERVRSAVEQLQIGHAPSAMVPWVTISAGIAESRRGTAESLEAWLGRADAALYAAKGQGRNRVMTDSSAAA